MTPFVDGMSQPAARAKSPAHYITQYAVAGVLGLAALGLLAKEWSTILLLAAAFAAVIILGYVLYSIVKGDCDRILVWWVVLFPLGYYYLSFPRTAPIIQFDRTVVLILVGCIVATPKDRTWPIPREMKRVAIAWALVLVASLISFFQMPTVLLNAPPVLTIGRLIVEAFLLPALMGWYILRQFRLRPHAKWLHLSICIISVYCAAIGIAEVVLQRHVLTYENAGYYWAGDPTNPAEFAFLRPEGPFTTAGSFGLIGLISFFLLSFLWTLIRDESGRWHRGLHVLAMTAAILQPLLTLNRATYLTIVICIFISMFWSTGFRRILYLIGLGMIILIVVSLAVFAPSAFEDRSSSDDVYGRVAQNEQSWRIFVDHPLIGVGLMNFTPVAQKTAEYQSIEFQGVEQVDLPHNNIAWIAAEMGIMGLFPYLISQVLLIVAFRRLRSRGKNGEQAWRYFILLFLGYWLPGLTWTSAQSGDLNIWFMFALCLVYRYGIGEASGGAAKLSCAAA
ncbi:MAG TPA: O-antigen ligase family protein [Terracidiphilus sp.]|jgi:O-antigen ligase|nr:O-antigen ligase family protein [Terracidiphilus sp.]